MLKVEVCSLRQESHPQSIGVVVRAVRHCSTNSSGAINLSRLTHTEAVVISGAKPFHIGARSDTQSLVAHRSFKRHTDVPICRGARKLSLAEKLDTMVGREGGGDACLNRERPTRPLQRPPAGLPRCEGPELTYATL